MIKGNLPSSDLHATLDDLLWTSKYRLHIVLLSRRSQVTGQTQANKGNLRQNRPNSNNKTIEENNKNVVVEKGNNRNVVVVVE